MARQFLAGIDLAGIPPLRLRIENLGAAPGTPFGKGHAYYDTALSAPMFYDGTVFRNPFARGDHTGTQLAGSISNFAATVQATRLDQFAAPAAPVAFGGQRLTGLATPTTAGDAAEFSWVVGQIQSAAAGVVSRPPVRAVATGNLTLNGLQTVDGVSLAAGDRVLATGQTTASGNGVYLASSGSWTRATAEDQASEMQAGATWLAIEGTAYAGTQWRQATVGAITLGTTALSIVMFAMGASYLAGNGLQLVSSTFSIKLAASSGMVADATGLYIDTTVVVRKYAATIGDGTATSYTVTHNLNTQDITVSIRSTATNAVVEMDWTASSANTMTVTAAAALAAGGYRVVVHG